MYAGREFFAGTLLLLLLFLLLFVVFLSQLCPFSNVCGDCIYFVISQLVGKIAAGPNGATWRALYCAQPVSVRAYPPPPSPPSPPVYAASIQDFFSIVVHGFL